MQDQARVISGAFSLLSLNASAQRAGVFTRLVRRVADSPGFATPPLEQDAMRKHAVQARSATHLLRDTTAASMEVVASRLLALSDPREFGSRKQVRELSGMVSEKIEAGAQGWLGAATELGMLPYRLAASFAKPSALTTSGVARAWAEAGALWLGVGIAAASPARNKVVANRSKLRKRKIKRSPSVR